MQQLEKENTDLRNEKALLLQEKNSQGKFSALSYFKNINDQIRKKMTHVSHREVEQQQFQDSEEGQQLEGVSRNYPIYYSNMSFNH